MKSSARVSLIAGLTSSVLLAGLAIRPHVSPFALPFASQSILTPADVSALRAGSAIRVRLQPGEALIVSPPYTSGNQLRQIVSLADAQADAYERRYSTDEGTIVLLRSRNGRLTDLQPVSRSWLTGFLDADFCAASTTPEVRVAPTGSNSTPKSYRITIRSAP